MNLFEPVPSDSDDEDEEEYYLDILRDGKQSLGWGSIMSQTGNLPTRFENITRTGS
jgi:hypothetical protein